MHDPVITETAFNCPHCGAYTSQVWHDIHARRIGRDPAIPFFPREDFRELVDELDWTREEKEAAIRRMAKLRAKIVFSGDEADFGGTYLLNNVWASLCYNCKKWSLWVSEDLVYPPHKSGAIPNQDLPDNVLAVVEEARSIIDLSPKGAAALLRLAIQMLCKHVGGSGSNLNDDIAKMVANGLSPVVQKSLDVVRVIGNESVHPGEIDLNDDKSTAISLFDLVNVIAEQMITHPKHVDELYQKLPPSKKEAIDKRDSKGSKK